MCSKNTGASGRAPVRPIRDTATTSWMKQNKTEASRFTWTIDPWMEGKGEASPPDHTWAPGSQRKFLTDIPMKGILSGSEEITKETSLLFSPPPWIKSDEIKSYYVASYSGSEPLNLPISLLENISIWWLLMKHSQSMHLWVPLNQLSRLFFNNTPSPELLWFLSW